MSEPHEQGRSTLLGLFRSPLATSLLYPLSLLGTLFFLAGPDFQQSYFLNPGRIRLWHLLMALEPPLWLASLVFIANDFKHGPRAWPDTRDERTALVICTVLAGALNAGPFVVESFTRQPVLSMQMEVLLQLPHLRTKLVLLGMSTALVATVHIAGMLSVHVQLLGRAWGAPSTREEPEAKRLQDDVLRYQQLRSRLERFLGLSAAIIGLGTLSIGAFRDLLGEVLPSPSNVLPGSHAMIYGVYFTGLLASVYLPARETLKKVGQTLAARFVSQSPGADTTWRDWHQEQQSLHAHLGLQSTLLQDFQQGFSVLAPLLASLSSLILSPSP
jgi:hypothetical protein